MENHKKIIAYIAGPITSCWKNGTLNQQRKLADNVEDELVRLGYMVYNPYSGTDRDNFSVEQTYWYDHDNSWLEFFEQAVKAQLVDECIIVLIDGWEHSSGVANEIELAKKKGFKIHVWLEGLGNRHFLF